MPPSCKRITFCEDIKQKGWNETCDIDSTAIAWFAYHPQKKILRIIFHRNKWRRKRFRAEMYEYVEVEAETMNKFLRCPYGRIRQLPSRADSVGASFRKTIGRYDHDYRRKFLPPGFKYRRVPGKI